MATYKTILVATDFSDGARAALRQAVRLAGRFGASLHLLTVIGKPPPAHMAHADDAAKAHAALKQKANDQLDAVVAENANGLSITTHVRAGKPLDEIVALSDEINADLLVIGATGEGKRRWGTVAGRCVRKGPEKVLLIDPDSHGDFKKVIACVDFGSSLGAVCEGATDFAKAVGASATAIHCYHMPWAGSLYSGESSSEALESDEKFRESSQRQFAETCDGMNLEFIVDANTDRGILEYCDEADADLVVTGTTDRTAVAYWLLGTTAEKIMRDSPCSVLAIKSGQP